MSIYVGQGYLTITLDTGISLAGAASPRIYYKKPDGTEGYWEGTISGENISKQLDNDDLDQAGIWQFQAYCTIGGLTAWGEVVRERVQNTLE